MIKLIDRYGIEIAKKGKNRYYSPELKEEIINNVLLRGRSQRSISLDYAILNSRWLLNWIIQYKKNGDTIVEKIRRKPPKIGCKPKKKTKKDDRIRTSSSRKWVLGSGECRSKKVESSPKSKKKNGNCPRFGNRISFRHSSKSNLISSFNSILLENLMSFYCALILYIQGS